MSAWTIYWVLILDNVQRGLFVTITAILVSIGVCFFACCAHTADAKEADAARAFAKWSRWSLRGIWLTFILLLANIFLPSTKQMATILVLPAIVNDERVQHEASELYELAK